MQQRRSILATGQLVAAAIPATLGAWFFGAWETWWFWPFATLVFISGLAFGWRVMAMDDGLTRVADEWRGAVTFTAGAWALFLVYAAVRGLQTPVRMTAERSVLLHLTAALLGVQFILGARARALRALALAIHGSLLAIGAYGIVNHVVEESRHVLWAPANPVYFGRATGCFYCPDHFSGTMELLFCIGLGRLLGGGTTRLHRALGAVSVAVGVTGIVLSKSRGGALTALAIVAVLLLFGLYHVRPLLRWVLRAGVVAAVAAAVAGAIAFDAHVVERMRQFPWKRVQDDSRYQMTMGALRAWNESPATRVFGIGPGMHQNLWLHYAAEPGGDRAEGRWPAHPNDSSHSHEVHDDWVQLLEEYGIVGLTLFCFAGLAALHLLLRAYQAALARLRAAGAGAPLSGDHGIALGACLAAAAVAFHSLGDFNLQMPGILWMFTALTCLPIGMALRRA